MAKNIEPRFTITVDHAQATITDSDTTTLVDVYTAPTDDAKITHITMTNDDTSDNDVEFSITTGANVEVQSLGAIKMTLGAGSVNTIAVDDVMSQLVGVVADGAGNKSLMLKEGYKIRARVLTTMTAAKTLKINVTAGLFS